MKPIKISQSKGLSYTVLAFAFVIFLLTLAGGYISKFFGLIEFWPVNAIVVASVIRLCDRYCVRLFSSILIALFLGYVYLEDSQALAFVKALSDFLCVFAAVYLLQSKFLISDLRNHKSMLTVLFVGMIAALVQTVVISAGAFWTEQIDGLYLLSNFLGQWLGFSALLPLFLLLHLPIKEDDKRRTDFKKIFGHIAKIELLAPISTLILSYLLFYILGLPTAIIFIMAALLYCTYFFQQTSTAILIIITAIYIIFISNYGLFSHDELVGIAELKIRVLISLQLGMQTLVMVPLLVSSALAYRNDQIKALNKALDHDDLTGALSRQAFDRGATELITKTPPALYGNSILMLDIDFFKKLNDTHGHAAGDIVLMEFARSISNGIRPDDLFGRLGGEEFGLILPNTTVVNAVEIAERLRKDVERIELYYDSDEPLRITVSIGIAHDKKVASNRLEDLLYRADQAMYKAKNTGRNQVCVFE